MQTLIQKCFMCKSVQQDGEQPHRPSPPACPLPQAQTPQPNWSPAPGHSHDLAATVQAAQLAQQYRVQAHWLSCPASLPPRGANS